MNYIISQIFGSPRSAIDIMFKNFDNYLFEHPVLSNRNYFFWIGISAATNAVLLAIYYVLTADYAQRYRNLLLNLIDDDINEQMRMRGKLCKWLKKF